MSSGESIDPGQLRQNIAGVQQRVEAALAKASRAPGSVKLVAVSKYVDAAMTWQLVEAGCVALGESRPQSIWQKHESFQVEHAIEATRVQWHMIGHMQRNKVARTLPLIQWLHSLDSIRLAEAISAEAVKQSLRLKCLLEVNATEDTTKTGLPVDAARDTLEQILSLPGIEVCGLMSMSTEGASADQARREFERVRTMRDDFQTQFGAACDLRELSMGMSGDFEQAIAAGATMIRVGSVLWSAKAQP